jgi:release factor glutamine methyltransferase
MQLKQALDKAMRGLDENAVGSPRMNAEVLLMFTLGCDRAYLYAHPERELTADEILQYEEVLAERSRGVPSQYLTGHQEFWGLDLIVTPAVLIPRPETEHVVETVLELARSGREHAASTSLAGKHRYPRDRLRIVDVGTGSGCIALALARELPNAEVLAADISPEALEIARINAARLELADRVEFFASDLLACVPVQQGFDFVVSNPPYVGQSEADKVQREVKKFEPAEAVFAGVEGLDLIARLIPQAHESSKADGWLIMEIGYTQEEKVRGLLTEWTEVRTIPDLRGIPRVIAARK